MWGSRLDKHPILFSSSSCHPHPQSSIFNTRQERNCWVEDRCDFHPTLKCALLKQQILAHITNTPPPHSCFGTSTHHPTTDTVLDPKKDQRNWYAPPLYTCREGAAISIYIYFQFLFLDMNPMVWSPCTTSIAQWRIQPMTPPPDFLLGLVRELEDCCGIRSIKVKTIKTLHPVFLAVSGAEKRSIFLSRMLRWRHTSQSSLIDVIMR